MDEPFLLQDSLDKMGIRYSASQIKKLLAFRELLMEKNRTMNLTGPAHSTGIIIRHILDSVSPISVQEKLGLRKQGINILDLGSGGGLPGIPLGILLEHVPVTLLEKSTRKTGFLLQAVNELSLDNISVLKGRAEELAGLEEWREKFFFVTARAVSKINILLELSVPFCTINGKIIFYKSRKVFGEANASSAAVNILGGRIDDLIEVDIPGLDEFRALLVISKVKSTPKKFPRKFSQLKKKPL